MLTVAQSAALEKIGEASVACERLTGIPAELTAAQCILESGWLAHAPQNNCFGIKHSSGPDNYQLTREYLNGNWLQCEQDFQAYDSLAACFAAHARLLKQGPYQPAWEEYQKTHDLPEFISGISAHYATDLWYAPHVAELSRDSRVLGVLQRYRTQQ